jgi:hypothetical protein
MLAVACGTAGQTQSATQATRSRSCSHNALIRVYDAVGNMIETHEHAVRVQNVVSETKQKAATR